MIIGHGDDIHSETMETIINFSSNVADYNPSSDLIRHLQATMHKINRYPEPAASSACRAIARLERVSAENIIATNGAVEAIYMIAREFYGAKSAIVVPTFREYQDSCVLNQHQVVFIPNTLNIVEIAHKVNQLNCNILWLCNPNNPDGKHYTPSEIMFLSASLINVTIVIDNSYSWFCEERTIGIDQMCNTNNIITISSLTKKHTIPGLRAGFIAASERLISKLKRQTVPWSLNSLAVEAICFIEQNNPQSFDDKSHLNNLLKERRAMVDNLLQLSSPRGSISIKPTTTHYFLGHLESDSSANLKQYLLQNHNLLIRDASNFETLSSGHFRVAVRPSTEDNDKLIKGISEYLNLKKEDNPTKAN